MFSALPGSAGSRVPFRFPRGLLLGSTFPSATWDSPVRACQERTPGLGEVMSMKVGRKALCGQCRITTQTFPGSLHPGSACCCHAGGWGGKPKGRAVTTPPLLARDFQTILKPWSCMHRSTELQAASPRKCLWDHHVCASCLPLQSQSHPHPLFLAWGGGR